MSTPTDMARTRYHAPTPTYIWPRLWPDGTVVYSRPYQYPDLSVTWIPLRVCNCDSRRGPLGGCCGGCSMAIPTRREAAYAWFLLLTDGPLVKDPRP